MPPERPVASVMGNKEYWTERALERENEAYLRGVDLTGKMFREYEIAAKEIRLQINDFYAKYAGKYGLTYEQAVKLLTQGEYREWKADLAEYMAKIAQEQDPHIKAMLTAQLDALSTNSQLSRLEALLGQIDMKLNELFEQGVAQMKAEFGEAFREGYYKKIYDLQSRAGFVNEIARISEDMVEKVLTYPWSGAMFSDRLWQNKQALLFHLRETITQGVMQGKSIAAMSKELSAKMGQSYKAAERLIRTETSHFHGEADKAAYEAAGIEEYEYVATLDARTCAVCGALDGKHFRVEDAQAGVNYPPMHPNDRCTTVEYDPNDAMDWYNSGKPMPKNMTYEEWYQLQVEEHGSGYVEMERKKAYHATADRKTWEEYKELLGKDAPSSPAKFQDIKYGDPDLYRMYKLDYKRRSRLASDPSLKLPGAENACAEQDKFLKYLFNPDNPRGYAKGVAFADRLGYNKDNWKGLQAEILRRAGLYPIRAVGNRGYGMKKKKKMVLYGKTGKPTNVVVSWIEEDGRPRMVSAYIKEATDD